MAKKQFFWPKSIPAKIDLNGVFQYRFDLVTTSGWSEEEPGQTNIVQATGNLTFGTERSDLKVFIEGYERIPPIELKKVPAGIYDIRIVGTNIDKVISITVNVGQNVFIDLDTVIKK